MNHHEVIPDRQEQGEFNFDREGVVIASAECFDDRRPFQKKVVKRRLTSIGDGRYIDDEDWIYEAVLPRADKGPDLRFTFTGDRYRRDEKSNF